MQDLLYTFRRFVRNLNRRVWLGVAVLAVVVFVAVRLTRPRQDSITPQVAQATIDAASTQVSVGYSEIPALLTLTPREGLLTSAAPTLSLSGHQEVRQWAASAQADSEFGSPEWAAVQAAGAPNTSACGDFRTAWASALPNGPGVLTLLYAQLVTPTFVNVFQSFNPGFITQVELVDVYGERHAIYQATPQPVGQCPFVLVIPVEADYASNTVIVTVDQTTSPGGWNQIDAVELVGIKR
jgi:hypothetical protein